MLSERNMFILAVIMMLHSNALGLENDKVEYLDEYGLPTSFLMEQGHIHAKCSKETPSEKRISFKSAVSASPSEDIVCRQSGSKFTIFEEYQDKDKHCTYACNSGTAVPCTTSTVKPHRCPHLLRSRYSGGSGHVGDDIEYWEFKYTAVCTDDTKTTVHQRAPPISPVTTGSLCDFDFETTHRPITLAEDKDCAGKFKIWHEGKPANVIHVSQTVFVNKPTLSLEITSGVTVTDIEIYDKADVTTAKQNKMIPKPTKLNNIDIKNLEVRKDPYKVVIKTANARHWFYLITFDVAFILTKTIRNGEAEVKCVVAASSKYQSALEAAEVELYSVDSDGTKETILETDVTTTKIPGRYRCKLMAKTKKVCFPYEQEMTTIELGNKEVEVEPEDLVTTTTTTTTTTSEQSTTTTTEIDSTSISSTKPTEGQTDPETEKRTETMKIGTTTPLTTHVTSTPPDFNFKIYLSDEVTNTSEDLTSASKLLVTERCEDIATEKGCNSCKFNVGRLVTGQDPFIPIDVTGFTGRMKRSLTIEQLQSEFSNNLNENSMVKRRKKSLVKVDDEQGRINSEKMSGGKLFAIIFSSTIGSLFLVTVTTMGISLIKETNNEQDSNDHDELEEDQADDDETIESINSKITGEPKNPKK